MPENINPDNHRHSKRVDLDGDVQVRLTEAALEGPGQNLSKDGVYLIAGEIQVEVLLPGETDYRKGFLVRANQVRDGEMGLAIRFIT